MKIEQIIQYSINGKGWHNLYPPCFGFVDDIQELKERFENDVYKFRIKPELDIEDRDFKIAKIVQMQCAKVSSENILRPALAIFNIDIKKLIKDIDL